MVRREGTSSVLVSKLWPAQAVQGAHSGQSEGINLMVTSEKLSHGSKLPPMSKNLELRALGSCLHWLSTVLEKAPRQLLKKKKSMFPVVWTQDGLGHRIRSVP